MALVVVQDDEYADQLVVQVHMKPLAVMQLLPAHAPSTMLPLGGVLQLMVQLLDEHGHVLNSADGIGLQVQCKNCNVVTNVAPLAWPPTTHCWCCSSRCCRLARC